MIQLGQNIKTLLLAADCIACHQQCQLGCTGPSATDCERGLCKAFKMSDTSECLSHCPIGTYADGTDCKVCSSQLLPSCYNSKEDFARTVTSTALDLVAWDLSRPSVFAPRHHQSQPQPKPPCHRRHRWQMPGNQLPSR